MIPSPAWPHKGTERSEQGSAGAGHWSALPGWFCREGRREEDEGKEDEKGALESRAYLPFIGKRGQPLVCRGIVAEVVALAGKPSGERGNGAAGGDRGKRGVRWGRKRERVGTKEKWTGIWERALSHVREGWRWEGVGFWFDLPIQYRYSSIMGSNQMTLVSPFFFLY